MRKLLLILCSVLLVACNHQRGIKEKQLADTVERLRIHTAYKPLKSTDAYDFINKYYLPRLDSLRIGRKIFLYPLISTDFKRIFADDSIRLVAEYSGNTVAANKVKLRPPPPIKFNKKYTWDKRKLLNTEIISEAAILNLEKYPRPIEVNDRKTLIKKYGVGYICISYPQYNPYINKLIISEWLENWDSCGTGRDKIFVFTKIPGGWKADN